MTKTDKHEAYVLSESSTFASKRRFILKTCGTTLLLKALVPLLKLARDYSGFDSIQSFFYSRKNFMKPSHQRYPHRNFQEEIEFLNAVFPNGAACCMGRMNSDCWYLYTLDFPESRVINQPDQTLEILMSELDPEVMDQFYMKDGVTAKDVTRVSIFNNNSVSCLAAKYFGSFSISFPDLLLNQSLAFFPGEWNS